MKKEISPQEYKDLPRKAKRELKRSLDKQGLEMPDLPPERIVINESVDKELFLKAQKVCERNGISIGVLIDKACEQIILAEK